MTTKINPAAFAALTSVVAELVAGLQENAAASSEANEASKERKGTVAEHLRAFARKSHDEGISVEESLGVYRAFAAAAELKKGTVNGYGASFAGFRKLLDESKDIDAYNVKQAQEEVASEETKALNAARKRLKDAMKDKKVWTAERVNELAELAESMIPSENASATEREEVTAEAIAA